VLCTYDKLVMIEMLDPSYAWHDLLIHWSILMFVWPQICLYIDPSPCLCGLHIWLSSLIATSDNNKAGTWFGKTKLVVVSE
jgi:hypothetical protein